MNSAKQDKALKPAAAVVATKTANGPFRSSTTTSSKVISSRSAVRRSIKFLTNHQSKFHAQCCRIKAATAHTKSSQAKMNVASSSSTKKPEVKYHAIDVPDTGSSSRVRPTPTPNPLSAAKGSFQSRYKPSPYNTPTLSSLSRAAKTPATSTKPSTLVQQRSAVLAKTPSIRTATTTSSASRTPSVRINRPPVTPSTSSFKPVSKSRTPVQIINQQYREAKKRLSRTVDCARTSIRRSIRILQEQTPSSRSLWRKGLVASGTKIPVYNGTMRTYPATEGKVRTAPLKQEAPADSASIRKSAKGRRSSRFSVGEMEQGCFLITPKVMRKLFATASNVGSIDETDETADEPVKVHSVKPSALFKYLFSDIKSESKVLLENEIKCQLQRVNELKEETSPQPAPSPATEMPVQQPEPVKTEASSASGAEAETTQTATQEPVLQVVIKKSQSSYEFLAQSNQVVSEPVAPPTEESIYTDAHSEEHPQASASIEAAVAEPETQVAESTPILETPVQEAVMAPVQETVETPAVEPVTEEPKTEVERPVEPIQQQHIESASELVLKADPIEQVPVKDVDLTVNFQTVPDSAETESRVPELAQVEEPVSNVLVEAVTIVDESLTEPVEEQVQENQEPAVEEQEAEPTPVEETVYVEIASESIQCDLGDQTSCQAVEATPVEKSVVKVEFAEPEQEKEPAVEDPMPAVEETVYVEIASESIQCDFGDQTSCQVVETVPAAPTADLSLVKVESASAKVDCVNASPDQATNLVDQLVQVTQSVRQSVSKTPLKEANRGELAEEQRQQEALVSSSKPGRPSDPTTSPTKAAAVAATEAASLKQTEVEEEEDVENKAAVAAKKTPAKRTRRKKAPEQTSSTPKLEEETEAAPAPPERMLTRAQRAKLNLIK